MVDVSGKPDTERVPRKPQAMGHPPSNSLKMVAKVCLAVAQVAGIMAAKKPQPDSHVPPAFLTSVDLGFSIDKEQGFLRIESRVKTTGRTGVEMEALTAVAIAALTVYDMCKSVDRWMRIEGISLLEKSGGKSGHLRREDL